MKAVRKMSFLGDSYGLEDKILLLTDVPAVSLSSVDLDAGMLSTAHNPLQAELATVELASGGKG